MKSANAKGAGTLQILEDTAKSPLFIAPYESFEQSAFQLTWHPNDITFCTSKRW